MTHFTKFPKLPFLIRLGLFVTAGFALAATGFSQETRQSGLEWNLTTTVGAYQKVGHANLAWDEPAKRALTEYARMNKGITSQDGPSEEIIRTNCDAAIKAGCDDPMVRYMYVRYSMSQTNSPEVLAKAFYDVALDMQKSSYPNIRKFYAADRAVNQANIAFGYTNALTMPVVKEITPLIDQNLLAVVHDKTIPPEDVYEACAERLTRFNWGRGDYFKAYSMIEPDIVHQLAK